MTDSSSPTSPDMPARVDGIDALRGFALAGVAWVHMIEQYLAGPMPPEPAAALMPGAVDQVIAGVNFLFFQGKFYILFSLLFGLSFFIQMDRAKLRGIDFRARFAWRLAILFAIGFLHHFVYRGDILMIYAVLGLLLLALFRAPGGILLALAGALFFGAGRCAYFLVHRGQSVFGGEMAGPESEDSLSYFQTISEGSFLDVAAINLERGIGHLIDFQFGFFGRGYVTLGLFCVGLWLGRSRFFETCFHTGDDATARPIKRGIQASIAFAIVSFLLMGLLFSRLPQPLAFDTWGAVAAFTAYDLLNLSFASLYLFAFVAIYRRAWGERLLRFFAPLGRMALSNYVLQSIVGALVFYGWGFGRAGQWRNLYALAFGVVFIALQTAGSAWWLRRFRYGPLEWIWRSLTWGKIFLLRQQCSDV